MLIRGIIFKFSIFLCDRTRRYVSPSAILLGNHGVRLHPNVAVQCYFCFLLRVYREVRLLRVSISPCTFITLLVRLNVISRVITCGNLDTHFEYLRDSIGVLEFQISLIDITVLKKCIYKTLKLFNISFRII